MQINRLCNDKNKPKSARWTFLKLNEKWSYDAGKTVESNHLKYES